MTDVQQCDRDAAAAFLFNGSQDDLLQAFARHREQTVAEIVAWLRERGSDSHAEAARIARDEPDDDDVLSAWVTRSMAYSYAADAIERGDYRSKTDV